MEGPPPSGSSPADSAATAPGNDNGAAAAALRRSEKITAPPQQFTPATTRTMMAPAPALYDPSSSGKHPSSSSGVGTFSRGGRSSSSISGSRPAPASIVPGQAITMGRPVPSIPRNMQRGISPVPPPTTLTGKSTTTTPLTTTVAGWDPRSQLSFTQVFGMPPPTAAGYAGQTQTPGSSSVMPPFPLGLPPTSFLGTIPPPPPHQQAMMPPTKKRRSSSSGKQRGGGARSSAGEKGGVSGITATKQGRGSKKRRGGSSTTTLPAEQQQPPKPTVTIRDDYPTRIVNPLLDLPLFPPGNPPPEYIPNGAELYNWTELYLCQPDTFPISYYARLLGFDVPYDGASSTDEAYVALDPTKVPIIKDSVWTSIPQEGRFAEQVWKQMPDERMDYMDPMYRAIWKDGRDPSHLSPATNVPGIPCISNECLAFAKEQELLPKNDDWTFDFATTDQDKDELEKTWPHFNVTVATNNPGEFVIMARHKTILKGCIHYTFQWYRFEDDASTTEPPVTPGAYGMTSAAASLPKPKVSELVFSIDRVECCTEDTGTEEAKAAGSDTVADGPLDKTGTTEEHLDDPTAIILAALALEHARGSDIWYGIQEVPTSDVALFSTYFRMATLPSRQDTSADVVHLVCDLKKCSYKYAFMLKRERDSRNGDSPLSGEEATPSIIRERMLVRMPNVDEAKAALEPTTPVPQRIARSKSQRKSSMFFSSANENVRSISFGIRANLPTPESPPLQLHSLADNGEQGTDVLTTASGTDPRWEVLRIFPMGPPVSNDSDNGTETQDNNEILQILRMKQKELGSMENGFEPRLRSLLEKVIDERMSFESTESVKEREATKKTLKEYEAVLERRREMDRAWQKQLEQDMDAVCDICNDGEVTPDNQILFCEACNVAVHQFCYGITKVPEGDYYCLACRYFQREKMSQNVARQLERGAPMPRIAVSALPICCELCPRKQGAFIRTDTSNQKPKGGEVVLSKWIHVMCAKWQGVHFVSPDQKDVVEDVTKLKEDFRHVVPRPKCILCLGHRGAFNQCNIPDCGNWLHVTCARATGLCKVRHGENATGDVGTDPWTLYCPEHSDIDPDAVPKGRVTIDELVRAAKEFPPEPAPKPPFKKMNGKMRRRFLADPEYEQELLGELMQTKSQGVLCEVCHSGEQDGADLTRCVGCRVAFCDSCKLDADGAKGQNYKCKPCRYVEKKRKSGEPFEEPHCHMCYQKGGWMRRGFANPVNKKSYWKLKEKEFEKTLFVKDLWCHALCTLWQSKYIYANEEAQVDCSSIIMSNGRDHILGSHRCALCWQNGGLKVQCNEEGCRAWGEKRNPFFFHATCARQAGLEVKDMPDGDSFLFYAKCSRHSGNGFAFRARLEDLIEIEKKRAGKRLARVDSPMNLAQASRLLNAACLVMSQLGWAWRWAEWWVEHGDNWEPFLEPSEKEDQMTDEELRIVHSTRESRCADARKCRLSALSAALRNRNYDIEEGDDKVALDRALRSMLHAKSLVGPLEPYEIDFFAEWLGRAYRSKSRLLGFGEDKIPVANNGRCVHIDGGSPKCELGSRPLPGKYDLEKGEVFESVMEVDDFLKPETLEDRTLVTEKILKLAKKKRKKSAADGSPVTKKRRKQRQKMKLIDAPFSPPPASPGRKSKKHAESNTVAEGQSPTNTPKKRGRRKKIHSASKPTATPTGLNSPKKKVIQSGKRRGRQPKSPPAPSTEVASGIAVRKEASGEFDAAIHSPKRRGRPPKSPPAPSTEVAVGIAVRNGASGELDEAIHSPKRRGRPPKSPSAASAVFDGVIHSGKRRGRPPKSPPAPPADLASKGAARKGSSTKFDEVVHSRKRRGRPPKGAFAEFDEEDSAPSSIMSERIPRKTDVRSCDADSGRAGPKES